MWRNRIGQAVLSRTKTYEKAEKPTYVRSEPQMQFSCSSTCGMPDKGAQQDTKLTETLTSTRHAVVGASYKTEETRKARFRASSYWLMLGRAHSHRMEVLVLRR